MSMPDHSQNPYNAMSNNAISDVRILDTTLREGEQCPGVSFTRSQRLQLAWMLDRFGVNMIEISPVVTKSHEETCKTLAESGLKADVIAHVRALESDIDVALRCGVRWVAMYLAFSDIHLANKLHLTREQALDRAVSAIDYAKAHGLRLRFTIEDSSRVEPSFLQKICRTLEEAGADRIGITDTVGVMRPSGMYNLVKTAREVVRVPLDVHCHNDLGLALANSLAGLEAGANQVHVAVNGIGERVGITTLAEFVMSITLLYGVKLRVRYEMLREISETVASYTGIPVHDLAPVVGANAFRHKSGTHIAAILRSPEAYEPFPPELVGATRRVVFSDAIGKHGAALLLNLLGLETSEESVLTVVKKIKELNKGELFELELTEEMIDRIKRMRD